jgi:predicted PurR-regulated permease PerM
MDLYLLSILFFIKDITYLIACSFLMIYLSYVIVVVIQSKYQNQDEDEETSRVIRNAKEF